MDSNQPTTNAVPEELSSKPKSNPPAVITVDTSGKDSSAADAKSLASEEKGLGQVRTPKHANKSREEERKDTQQKITPDRHGKTEGGPNKQYRPSMTGPPPRAYGGFSPPRPYEGRPLGGNGAFHPHESRQNRNDPSFYNNGRPPMHVSPSHGHAGDYRYYNNGDYHRGVPPPGGFNNGYDQRGYAMENPNYRPAPGGQYRGPSYPPSYNGYDQSNSPSAWGPPSFSRRPPPYPNNMPPVDYQRPGNAHEGRYIEQSGGNNTFSRAVSSSFGSRSDDKPSSASNNIQTMKVEDCHRGHSSHPSQQDHSVAASDDLSWRQLNQVASVDEAVMRERLENEKRDSDGRDIKVEQPSSNSSSLTNSPTEGHEQTAKRAASIPTPSKLTSLDSLSSVASVQEPLNTTKGEKPAANPPGGPLSPGSSASLDLMKCSSGSSGLLPLSSSHHRDLSHGWDRLESKRTRDEQRGDVNTAKATESDDRRAPSDHGGKTDTEHRPAKRGRHEDTRIKEQSKNAESKFKSSPLSISCSPPQSPAGEKRSRDDHRPTASQHSQHGYSQGKNEHYSQSPAQIEGSYFDKAPSYTYSMDSAAPSFTRENQRQTYHHLSHRPGSSSSSTITPMQVDPNMASEGQQSNGVGPSLPSWEIQPQDSFSGGSTGGGNQLMNSFSFSQDYPMLSSSGSNLGYGGENGPPLAPHPPSHNQPPSMPHPPLESRNQSFEGGHYHGSFSRSESMDMSYSSRPGGPPYQENYKMQQQHPSAGQFIHHAPSWGSHGPPPGSQGHFNQYNPRLGPGPPGHSYSQGPMMRNYSEERVSPPPGPPGMRMVGNQRPAFQPPPEFVAPHHPHLARRPQQAVYLMSSPSGTHHPAQPPKPTPSGVFTWSKDDDVRLTEIMKKYKNPRDWEPIAKEHGRGRTAKECHERWIRYLKPGVRKGQWTDHEDAIVIEAVTTSTEQPFTRWSDLAQRLPGRVGKQIRDRWVNHLNPEINHLPFSREDDLLLWEGHKKLGKRWVEISTKFFNSTRSENHIKNRWYSASFKKFIANEFGPDAYSGGKATRKDDSKSPKSKKKSSVKDEDSIIEAV